MASPRQSSTPFLEREHNLCTEQISSCATSFRDKRAYQKILGKFETIPAISWLWNSCCPLRHKIFFWLFLYNRLNIKEMLQRKVLVFIQHFTCGMCGQRALETRDHLFLPSPIYSNLMEAHLPKLTSYFWQHSGEARWSQILPPSTFFSWRLSL